MKGQNILNHIVREEMPDTEQVRENCHNQFASQRARRNVRLKKLLPIAAAFILVFAVSVTAFAATGAYARIMQWARFGSVVTPVMVYAEDEGLRITAIGAQAIGNMTVVYLSVQELTGEGRLSENMDWWPGLQLNIDGLGGGVGQNLLYFDSKTNTAYLEVRLAADQELSSQITLMVDSLTLYPAESIVGNWAIQAYTGETSSQHMVAIAHEFMLRDVILVERMTLTPLGLSVTGTFGAPGDMPFMAPMQDFRTAYVETHSGLIPLDGAGVGVTSYCRSHYEEDFVPVRIDPTVTTVAEKMESHVNISVRMDWEAASPIDVRDVVAVIVDGTRIEIGDM